MSAEAQFLQSRQARRLVASNQQEERQSRTDVLHAFWSALKARLGRWKARLETLQTSYSSNDEETVVTEEKKRTLHMELCQLEEELKYWKKLCLADTTGDASTMSSQYDNKNKDDDDDDFLSLCPPDLPLSDVRLLHTHFSECQTRLDQVRKSLLPRGKFVFRRYREALLRQNQQQQQACSAESTQGVLKQASTVSATATITANTTKRHEYDDPGRTISNQKHVRLVVHTDGRVERLSGNDRANEKQQQQQLAIPLSFLLLKNLEHCEITIHGRYQSLHLISVVSSQVRLQHKVEGAIHVTNCHDTSLWSQSQQLRLHESSHLECHVQVSSSGAIILEDCSELVFYCSSSNDNDAAPTVWDIKDFNWLKKGIPSPNFRVEVEEDEDKTTPPMWHEPIQATVHRDRDIAASHPSTATADSSPPSYNSNPAQGKNEEEEDEL